MAVRFTSDCGQPGFVSNSQGKLSEQSRKRYEDKYAQHYVYTEHQIYVETLWNTEVNSPRKLNEAERFLPDYTEPTHNHDQVQRTP